VELDARHLIGRKFVEQCGFMLESVLRKHRIVNRRNRDTALYVILNNEWPDAEIKLKKKIGISNKADVHKIAAIEEADKLVNEKKTIKISE
jgi:hypothetical protein